MSQWQVGVSAEAFAAGMFARCGLNVSVQYGPNQPEYDLIANRGDQFLKVSVKGSQDGSWGLTQSYLSNADYHSAIDAWTKCHTPRTIYCFVQFKDVAINALPRMYVATPAEISKRLRETRAGRGDTILHESKSWGPMAIAKGTSDTIPDAWRFTESRIEELLTANMTP